MSLTTVMYATFVARIYYKSKTKIERKHCIHVRCDNAMPSHRLRPQSHITLPRLTCRLRYYGIATFCCILLFPGKDQYADLGLSTSSTVASPAPRQHQHQRITCSAQCLFPTKCDTSGIKGIPHNETQSRGAHSGAAV